jgi:hypothetical protein
MPRPSKLSGQTLRLGLFVNMRETWGPVNEEDRKLLLKIRRPRNREIVSDWRTVQGLVSLCASRGVSVWFDRKSLLRLTMKFMAIQTTV